MKRSERKAKLIRRLLTNWQLKFDLMSIAFEGNNDPCSGSTSKSLSSGKWLVVVQSWTKSLASLANFPLCTCITINFGEWQREDVRQRGH